MSQKDLSVEEIIAMYSNKKSAPKENPTAQELADMTLSRTPISVKTELIEDVLEVGDNSFVYTPAEEFHTEPLPTPPKEEPTPLAFSTPTVLEPDVPEITLSEPSAPEITLSGIGVRRGGRTTSGTQAIEDIRNKKPTPQNPTAPVPQPQFRNPAPKQAPLQTPPIPKRPQGGTIIGISENSDDSQLVADLKRLKEERSQNARPRISNVPPVNRASIGSIDLDIEKKVIPNTEVGIGDNATDKEKLAYLNAKRRERVKQFVEESEEPEKQKGNSIADFESFDQAREMSKRISTLKGHLGVRFAVLFVASIVSAVITILSYRPDVTFVNFLDNATALLFFNILLGLASCFVSFTVITVGLKNLFTLKADSDSLAAISSVLTILSGIILLIDPVLIERKVAHCYISVSIIGLLVNTLGKLLIVNRTERSFKYISGGYSKYAALHIDNEDVASKFTKGALTDFPSLSTARKTEFVTDFIKNSYSADLTDTFSKIYVPVVAIASVIIGILCYFVLPAGVTEPSQRIYYAVSCLAGAIAISSAVGMMLVVNIPLSKASRKYLQSSAVMLGYSAVEQFADTNSVLVDAVDLFPDGMAEITNIKPAKKVPIENGIIYAASLCCQTESILRPAFYKMIKGKTEMLLPVESYIYEDGLGLSGWIENKRVLFGTRALMESHSVQNIPTLEKEYEYSKGENVIYLSVGGTLAMLFVVSLKASVSVANSLKELEKQGITVIVRSVDSLLSITRLSSLFDVKPNLFKLLPFRYHTDYDAQTSYIERVSSPMIYSGRFASLAMLLVGAKRLQRSATVGVAVQTLSAIIGLVLALVFALLGSFGAQFTGTVVIIYSLSWLLVTAIVQSLMKV